MVAIACHGLCHLADQGHGVSQEQARQRAVAPELALQQIRRQAITAARTQHHRLAWRALAPRERRDADYALAASDCEFHRPPAFRYIEREKRCPRFESTNAFPGRRRRQQPNPTAREMARDATADAHKPSGTAPREDGFPWERVAPMTNAFACQTRSASPDTVGTKVVRALRP